MNLEFSLKPRTIALFLGILSLYFTLQSLFGEYINTNILQNQYSTVPALILDEFSVNAEQTVPTWYQTILLLSAAILLGIIARAKRVNREADSTSWAVLALIFLYLSIDEAAAIHEIFSTPLHTTLQTSGILAFGWQIAAAPFLILFAVFFLRFLFRLPPRTRNLFIAAGILYIAGAFVTDAISASLVSPGNELTLPYLTVGTLEEALEMAGQVTFIYALLAYIADMRYGIGFRADTVGKSSPFPIRRLLPIGLLVIVINLGLVYWAVTQHTPSLPTANNPVPIYQAIMDGFPQQGLLVTHMEGVFGSSDDSALCEYAAALLGLFDDVLVITVPSAQSSVFVAGRPLPFDRESLSDYLLSQGEIEFIIYDTNAIKAAAEQ